MPHPPVNLSLIDDIEDLAESYGIPVLFDSVEANGAVYKEDRIGGFGNAESFSLHPSKVINACEGGYITTKDSVLADNLRKLRQGYSVEHQGAVKSGHYSLINRDHAVMGICSLDIIVDVISNYKKQYELYEKELDELNGIELVKFSDSEERNYKSILIHLGKDFVGLRNEILDILNSENIFVRNLYYPAQNQTQLNKSSSCLQEYPVAEAIQNEYLLFPIGTSVTLAEIKVICQIFKDVLKIVSVKL